MIFSQFCPISGQQLLPELFKIAIFCLLFEEKSPKDISNTILLHTKLLFQCFLPYIEKILMISLQITENPDFIQPRNLTEISFEFDKFAKFNTYCQKFSTSPVFCLLFEEKSKKDIWNNIFLRSYFFSVFYPRFRRNLFRIWQVSSLFWKFGMWKNPDYLVSPSARTFKTFNSNICTSLIIKKTFRMWKLKKKVWLQSKSPPLKPAHFPSKKYNLIEFFVRKQSNNYLI